MRFPVTEAESGLRLDELLARRVPELSRMRLRQALDEGAVQIDGRAETAGYRVRSGERVTADLDLREPTAMSPEPIPVEVLFEDEAVAVVEKPTGLVVHPAGRHRGGTLANALAYHFNVAGASQPPVRPGIVHRLDRATSGLLVVAKSQEALSRLTVQFQGRQVEKRYLGLACGTVAGAAGQEPDEGVWEAPIGSDYHAFPRWGVREGGRPATSRFQVRERLPGYTLLELEPVTGRTAQLRLHAAHFGHALAGDELFGRGPEPGLERLFLHAAVLGFTHPVTGARLRFESPLPAPLEAFLETIRST